MGRVLLPWVGAGTLTPCVSGMRPPRMLQCLAPAQPSRAVGSVPRVCAVAPSPVAALAPGAGEGLGAEGCLGEEHSMGTRSQANDGPAARVSNDQSWCVV